MEDEHDVVAVTPAALDSALVRALVDKLPAMLAYWDANERCRFANGAYERWFGVDPQTMPGRRMSDFLGPLYALNKPYIDGALRGEQQEFEREIPDPAGGPARHSHALYIPDVVDDVVRGFSVLVVDITRRKRAEEALLRMERQLQATERLAAMATLAAGIAHEINNPLAAVVANLELTLASLERRDGDAAARSTLLEACDAADRIKTIVHSMKLLARGETTTREPVSVNDTIAQSIDVAWHVIRYRGRLVRELGPVGMVCANAAQLAQVFVNLLVNAAQALPETNVERNEIRVSTRGDRDCVVIDIADTGCGIPEALQTRIFEPFFTTKDVGGGLGLGLSISRGIVNAFGGTISVTSKVGEGSVFTVTLPASAAEVVGSRPGDAALPESSARSAVAPRSASASEAHAVKRLRVVVVDDEPMLTRSIQRMLTQCDVTVFENGRDAIAFLVGERPSVDLILCDLMMPEVTGADVHAEVTRQRPELADRFVIMTGGAFTPEGKAFLASVRVPVLEKPFKWASLVALVDARPTS